MKTLTLLIASVMLVGCGFSLDGSDSETIRKVKANQDRTDKFHKFNDKVQHDQAALQDWLTSEVKKCSVELKLKPQEQPALQFDQTGTLVCVAQPPSPPSSTASPVPSPPPPPPMKRN